jgi:acyl carrier protein
MKEQVFQILCSVMNTSIDNVNIESSSDNIKNWDSLNHMNLILSLEEEFNISFDSDQIIKMTSVKEILSSIKEIQSK